MTNLHVYGDNMPLSPCPTPRFRVLGVLICETLLLAASACNRAPSVEPSPAAAEAAASRPQTLHERGLAHFPGVDLVRAGHGAFLVQIHSRIVGDGEPLYVIDGQPTTVASNRGIDWFGPEDVAMITVVKNPADLAIYGPRAVNGVILITTKQGARPR